MEPQSPWGELMTFKKLLGAIPEDLKEYFDFIETWLSLSCTHDEKKRGIKDEIKVAKPTH